MARSAYTFILIVVQSTARNQSQIHESITSGNVIELSVEEESCMNMQPSATDESCKRL